MAQRGAYPWGWLVVCVGLVCALDVQPAHACSWGPCAPGYLLPRHGSTIPANTPALVWQASLSSARYSDGAVPNVQLVRLDESTESPTFRVVAQADGLNWLVLDRPLSAGGRYRLAVENDCNTPSSEFEVTAEAKLPTALGALQIETPAPAAARVATRSGSCSAEVAAVRAASEVELAADARPWADLLIYETRVDGSAFRPSTTIVGLRRIPEARALLFAECPGLYPPDMMRDELADYVGLAEGAHDVVLEARLPGTDATLASAAESVTLSCPASGVVPGTGVPIKPSAVRPASPADAGGNDGGNRADSDAGADDTASAGDDDDEEEDVEETAASGSSGCSMHANERGARACRTWTWALLSLGLLARWLPRRRR